MRRLRAASPPARRSSASPPAFPQELGVFFSRLALPCPAHPLPCPRETNISSRGGNKLSWAQKSQPPKPQLKRGAGGPGWGERQPPGLWPWLPLPASAIGTPSPGRDVASVLKQDRERLRAMQKQQPRFSEDQRRELGAVHSWVRKGQLPRALDVMVRGVWARGEKGR